MRKKLQQLPFALLQTIAKDFSIQGTDPKIVAKQLAQYFSDYNINLDDVKSRWLETIPYLNR